MNLCAELGYIYVKAQFGWTPIHSGRTNKNLIVIECPSVSSLRQTILRMGQTKFVTGPIQFLLTLQSCFQEENIYHLYGVRENINQPQTSLSLRFLSISPFSDAILFSSSSLRFASSV